MPTWLIIAYIIACLFHSAIEMHLATDDKNDDFGLLVFMFIMGVLLSPLLLLFRLAKGAILLPKLPSIIRDKRDAARRKHELAEEQHRSKLALEVANNLLAEKTIENNAARISAETAELVNRAYAAAKPDELAELMSGGDSNPQ